MKMLLKALGAVRVELNNMFNYAKDEYRFAWIVDWPMFEFNEDENKWDALLIILLLDLLTL